MSYDWNSKSYWKAYANRLEDEFEKVKKGIYEKKEFADLKNQNNQLLCQIEIMDRTNNLLSETMKQWGKK